jgi:hypothetical protein
MLVTPLRTWDSKLLPPLQLATSTAQVARRWYLSSLMDGPGVYTADMQMHYALLHYDGEPDRPTDAVVPC